MRILSAETLSGQYGEGCAPTAHDAVGGWGRAPSTHGTPWGTESCRAGRRGRGEPLGRVRRSSRHQDLMRNRPKMRFRIVHRLVEQQVVQHSEVKWSVPQIDAQHPRKRTGEVDEHRLVPSEDRSRCHCTVDNGKRQQMAPQMLLCLSRHWMGPAALNGQGEFDHMVLSGGSFATPARCELGFPDHAAACLGIGCMHPVARNAGICPVRQTSGRSAGTDKDPRWRGDPESVKADATRQGA